MRASLPSDSCLLPLSLGAELSLCLSRYPSSGFVRLSLLLLRDLLLPGDLDRDLERDLILACF